MRQARPSRQLYYCRIALTVSERGTCLRRRYGAVITNADMTEIVSTGYAGAPRGIVNCTRIGKCRRKELKIDPGDRYDLCRSVHAEMNAIIHAARRDLVGGRLFLAGVDAETGELETDADACRLCKSVIVNAGVAYVYILIAANKYRRIDVRAHWVKRQDTVFSLKPKAKSGICPTCGQPTPRRRDQAPR